MVFYLLRDRTLIQVADSPERIISEVNKALANFRTYGGLNFREEGELFVAYYGNMQTNLFIDTDGPETREAFLAVIQKNW